VQDATKDPDRVQTGRLTVTIHDVPDQPPAPTGVTASSGQASLTIAAPAHDNGKPVTAYTISWTGGSSGSKTVSSPGGVTITGLTNGKAYRFRVLATNSDGNSAVSGWSPSVTPWGQPSAPRSVSASAGKYATATLKMSWAAPSNTGGGQLTYRHRVVKNGTRGGWSAWSTATSASQSVGAGHYAVEVQAKNGGGKTSDATSSTITVSTKPDPPPAPAVTLAKGARTGAIDGCRPSGNCHYYVTTVSHFKPGTYDAKYYCNGRLIRTDPGIVKVGSGGSFRLDSGPGGNGMWHSYCGDSGYSVVNGVKSPTIDMGGG